MRARRPYFLSGGPWKAAVRRLLSMATLLWLVEWVLLRNHEKR